MRLCKCGSDNLIVDDWLSTAGKVEVFVRCRDCGKPGPSAVNDEEALKKWDEEAS
jgi:hypothetical protein